MRGRSGPASDHGDAAPHERTMLALTARRRPPHPLSARGGRGPGHRGARGRPRRIRPCAGVAGHRRSERRQSRRGHTPGYDQSADYVAVRLLEEFTFQFFEGRSPPTLPDDPGPPRGAEAGAAPPPSTSACGAPDFDGFERGAITLVRRGACTQLPRSRIRARRRTRDRSTKREKGRSRIGLNRGVLERVAAGYEQPQGRVWMPTAPPASDAARCPRAPTRRAGPARIQARRPVPSRVRRPSAVAMLAAPAQ